MQCFKYGHIISQLGEVSGNSESGRSGAGDGYFLTVGFSNCRDGNFTAFAFIIGSKSLQPANGHGFAFFTQNAGFFTLIFLRANTATNRRKTVGFFQNLCRLDKITFGNLFDEFRDLYVNRTAGDTSRLFALNAALCFDDRRFLGITEWHFFKVLNPFLRILLRHFLTRYFFFLFFGFFSFHHIHTYVFHKPRALIHNKSSGGRTVI